MSRFSRALATLAAIALLSVSAQLARADSFEIDPVHSTILFRIQHAGAGYTFGWFRTFSGTIVTDADPSKMSIQATADVQSIDTRNPQRDTHLKSNDFFSATEFPTITFKSTKVAAAADNKFDVTGDLSLHGQTKSITISLEKTGESDLPKMGHRAGFFTTFTIKRSDYGMSSMPGMVGDDVQLQIALEGLAK